MPTVIIESIMCQPSINLISAHFSIRVFLFLFDLLFQRSVCIFMYSYTLIFACVCMCLWMNSYRNGKADKMTMINIRNLYLSRLYFRKCVSSHSHCTYFVVSQVKSMHFLYISVMISLWFSANIQVLSNWIHLLVNIRHFKRK